MDKLEQLLTKMHSEFAEYEAWLLQQPASVILDNAFQYTTKQDILMHAESAELSPAQLEMLLRSRAPLEEVFETYRNTDSDFLMIEMHDAMETCADDAMAVQRTSPVYTQPPDYARERGELDKYRESKRLNVLCKEAIEQTVRDNYRDNRLDADAVWRNVTAQFGSKRAAFVLAMTVREKDFDGRFSRENKAWAKSQPLPPDPEHRGLYCSYVVDRAHPVLTDALVTHVRRELEGSPRSRRNCKAPKRRRGLRQRPQYRSCETEAKRQAGVLGHARREGADRAEDG